MPATDIAPTFERPAAVTESRVGGDAWGDLVGLGHAREVLDPALLRPGRFDLVLPVGLPDASERKELLRRGLTRCQKGHIDLDAISRETDGRTPADLLAICRLGAQAAFEREVGGGLESRLETADLRHAVRCSRPTLSPEELASFRDDVDKYARI